MIDYLSYTYSPREYGYTWLKGFCMGAVLLYLFYDNVLIGIIGGVFAGILYAVSHKKYLISMRKWELNMEFKEGIAGISTALRAGYSIENAFTEAEKDLRILYNGQSYIEKEFAYIEKQLALNRTVEELLHELAMRSGIEDIESFAGVFITAKRTGGDMVAIIQSTVKNINEKLEVKREIQTMVTAKKLEGKIMNLIPPLMIAYLRISSPGFLDPLYHNLTGMLIMSAMLGIYVLAYQIGKQILDMEV